MLNRLLLRLPAQHLLCKTANSAAAETVGGRCGGSRRIILRDKAWTTTSFTASPIATSSRVKLEDFASCHHQHPRSTVRRDQHTEAVARRTPDPSAPFSSSSSSSPHYHLQRRRSHEARSRPSPSRWESSTPAEPLDTSSMLDSSAAPRQHALGKKASTSRHSLKPAAKLPPHRRKPATSRAAANAPTGLDHVRSLIKTTRHAAPKFESDGGSTAAPVEASPTELLCELMEELLVKGGAQGEAVGIGSLQDLDAHGKARRELLLETKQMVWDRLLLSRQREKPEARPSSGLQKSVLCLVLFADIASQPPLTSFSSDLAAQRTNDHRRRELQQLQSALPLRLRSADWKALTQFAAFKGQAHDVEALLHLWRCQVDEQMESVRAASDRGSDVGQSLRPLNEAIAWIDAAQSALRSGDAASVAKEFDRDERGTGDESNAMDTASGAQLSQVDGQWRAIASGHIEEAVHAAREWIISLYRLVHRPIQHIPAMLDRLLVGTDRLDTTLLKMARRVLLVESSSSSSRSSDEQHRREWMDRRKRKSTLLRMLFEVDPNQDKVVLALGRQRRRSLAQDLRESLGADSPVALIGEGRPSNKKGLAASQGEAKQDQAEWVEESARRVEHARDNLNALVEMQQAADAAHEQVVDGMDGNDASRDEQVQWMQDTAALDYAPVTPSSPSSRQQVSDDPLPPSSAPPQQSAPTPLLYALQIQRLTLQERHYTEAEEVLQELVSKGYRPLLSHVKPFIEALCRDGRVEDAQRVKAQARDQLGVQPDLRVHAALMAAYAHLGDHGGVQRELLEIKQAGLNVSSDVVIRNILTAAAARQKHSADHVALQASSRSNANHLASEATVSMSAIHAREPQSSLGRGRIADSAHSGERAKSQSTNPYLVQTQLANLLRNGEWAAMELFMTECIRAGLVPDMALVKLHQRCGMKIRQMLRKVFRQATGLSSYQGEQHQPDDENASLEQLDERAVASALPEMRALLQAMAELHETWQQNQKVLQQRYTKHYAHLQSLLVARVAAPSKHAWNGRTDPSAITRRQQRRLIMQLLLNLAHGDLKRQSTQVSSD